MQLLFLQGWFSEEILKAIGWTLIHSLWQGLVAAVLAGIIIISTRKTGARHRYNLLGLVLSFFIITTVITFFQQLKNSTTADQPFTGLPVSVSQSYFNVDNYEVTTVSVKTTVERFVSYVNANAGFFVLIWAIFFLFQCIKLFTGLTAIQRIRNYKIHKSPAEWLTKMDQLCKTLHVKQTVGLLQSELVKVPVAIGFLKPVVLVPLGLLSNLPAEQVETILLHELAHIRRKDYLVNIMQRFIEAIFFFNPALLWISSLVRQEREACCDDIVVAHTTNKGSYLQALVSFQEYSFASSQYAMAIKSKQHYLLNRVKRMITRENKKLDVMEKIFLLMGLIVVTAFTFIPKEAATTKKNPIATTTTVHEPSLVASTKVKPVLVTEIPQPRKATIRKENKKPVIDVPMNIPPADTVPSLKKEKTGYSDLKFPGVSSTVNDDGNTRKETTTVTDQDGKKYTYTKLNNKITSLSIDGKAVPENEIGNYSSLFDKIEVTIQENKLKKILNMERRKAERADREEKNENMKDMANEKRLIQLHENAQKQNLLRQNRQSKLFEKSRKTLDDQRKETLKLIQKLKKQRMNVPMLNGREISKNDIPVHNATTADVPVETGLNKESVKIQSRTLEAKKANNYIKASPGNLELKSQRDITLSSEFHVDFDKNRVKDFEFKSETGPLNFHPKTINEKPGVPVKSPPGIKSREKGQPVKPKPGAADKLKYRVIT